MKRHFDAVIVRHVSGYPMAYPVVVSGPKTKPQIVHIVLSLEDRRTLDKVAKSIGKDGLAWCANIAKVENRSCEGNIEMVPARYYDNAETLAVDVESIAGRLPTNLYEGIGQERRPTAGLCWKEACLIEAVQLAFSLLRQGA